MVDVIARRRLEKDGLTYEVLIYKPEPHGTRHFACRWSLVDRNGATVKSQQLYGIDTAQALTFVLLLMDLMLGPGFTYADKKDTGFPLFRPAEGSGKPGSYFLSSAGERWFWEGGLSTASVGEDVVRAMDVVARRDAERDGRGYQVLIEKPRRVSESEFVCRWVVVDRVGEVVESYRACGEDSAAALVSAVLSVSPCLGSRFTCDGEDGAGFPRYRPAVEAGAPGSWVLPFTDEL